MLWFTTCYQQHCHQLMYCTHIRGGFFHVSSHSLDLLQGIPFCRSRSLPVVLPYIWISAPRSAGDGTSSLYRRHCLTTIVPAKPFLWSPANLPLSSVTTWSRSIVVRYIIVFWGVLYRVVSSWVFVLLQLLAWTVQINLFCHLHSLIIPHLMVGFYVILQLLKGTLFEFNSIKSFIKIKSSCLERLQIGRIRAVTTRATINSNLVTASSRVDASLTYAELYWPLDMEMVSGAITNYSWRSRNLSNATCLSTHLTLQNSFNFVPQIRSPHGAASSIVDTRQDSLLDELLNKWTHWSVVSIMFFTVNTLQLSEMTRFSLWFEHQTWIASGISFINPLLWFPLPYFWLHHSTVHVDHEDLSLCLVRCPWLPLATFLPVVSPVMSRKLTNFPLLQPGLQLHL